jgi:hypothetical protein
MMAAPPVRRTLDLDSISDSELETTQISNEVAVAQLIDNRLTLLRFPTPPPGIPRKGSQLNA